LAGAAAEVEAEAEAEAELVVATEELADALWLAVEALDPHADSARARAPAAAAQEGNRFMVGIRRPPAGRINSDPAYAFGRSGGVNRMPGDSRPDR
jgi:hypothetical protein